MRSSRRLRPTVAHLGIMSAVFSMFVSCVSLLMQIHCNASRYICYFLSPSAISFAREAGVGTYIEDSPLTSLSLSPSSVARRLVFQYYEEYMRAHNAIDFEDMLLHTKSLMEKRPDVRQRIRSTFTHVLIDEVRLP
jgi:hypothetical protein